MNESVVTFHAPDADWVSPNARVYELALVLVEKLDLVIEQAERARFHIKDQLDRSATAIVIQVGRAKVEARAERRRAYRIAHRLTVDVNTILDILQRRHSTFADLLGPARVVAVSLLEQLATLAAD